LLPLLLLPFTPALNAQSVQTVMGQVSALTWVPAFDPSLLLLLPMLLPVFSASPSHPLLTSKHFIQTVIDHLQLVTLPLPPATSSLSQPQSVQTVMGQVSALTWVLTVDPTLLPGGPEVMSVAKEAFALADKEETLLLQRLPGRNLSLEVLTQLRVACIDLLNVMMAWEPFRSYPEPVSGEGGCSSPFFTDMLLA
jgi:hypothetical protein